MIIDHDVHVHTTLSACCSDPEATPANILARALEHGITTIGFADHMWHRECPGGSSWYGPQDLDHVMGLRDNLPADTGGMRVLCGCESEFGGPDLVGISEAAASRLDFVLLPMSHFHMRGFIVPEDLSDPVDVAGLMVERFLQLLELGIADGTAHPFLPCGHVDRADEIIAAIPDDMFRHCFFEAARKGVSIEITTGFFPGCKAGETEGFHDETFLGVLHLARQEGCRFHFASDSHTLAGIGSVLNLQPYVDELGIDESDVAAWVRADSRAC